MSQGGQPYAEAQQERSRAPKKSPETYALEIKDGAQQDTRSDQGCQYPHERDAYPRTLLFPIAFSGPRMGLSLWAARERGDQRSSSNL